MPAVEAIVWKLLNKEVSVHFGTECAAVATWTVIVMVIRFVLQLAKIIDFVPVGLIFAFPLIIQTFSKFLPTLKGRSPLLVIRLAESLVAKDHIGKLFALFPAHFLGSVIGIVFFRTILPFVSKQTLSPLHCASENVPVILITETVANFIYAAVILVLPYVLDVNRLHGWYINIPLLPLLSISISTFNPAILFGLWALNTNVLANNDCPLSITRIAGSCLGGLFAGWFCSNYFPDDPSSWTRSSKKSSK